MITIPFSQTPSTFLPLPNAPWQHDFPYRPEVEVALAHTGDALLLHFRVKEQIVRAVAPHDNGHVWEDSCCEFFVMPPQGDAYYNFECNAAGTLLIGCGHHREGRELAPPEVLQRVERQSSLGREPFDSQPAPETWELQLRIPVTALWHHQLTSFCGMALRVNIYKCGDKLPKPHFLSLFPIPIANPDFHRPDFFQMIVCE